MSDLAAATAPAATAFDGDPASWIDVAQLVHDLEVVMRHRGLSGQAVAREAKVTAPELSMLRNHRRASPSVLARVQAFIDPAAGRYLRAAPAEVA